MYLTGNTLHAKMSMKTVEVPIVGHPEANKTYLTGNMGLSEPDSLKQYRLLGIEADIHSAELKDFDPDNVTEGDVVVYSALGVYEEENGDLIAHGVTEPVTSTLDGFISKANREQLPLDKTLRVGELEGHVGHVLDKLASDISTRFLVDPSRNLEPEEIPDGVEFQLRSHDISRPEIEIVDLGGLAKEQIVRELEDIEDFKEVYSRCELDADEFESLSKRIREQQVTRNHCRCAELIGAELETKQVKICVPSEFFERVFQGTLSSLDGKLSDDEQRKRAREYAFERTPKEWTFDVLCGVKWNGQ